jgi:endonuclease/exonuclease/phosphatase family metal-dependent hydrolase
MAVVRHPLTAMTFNVRYDEEWDGEHRWTHRRGAVIATISAVSPDLLAIQEPTEEQAADIAAALGSMRAIGGGFASASRFDVVDGGAFGLPAAEARTCSWTRLRDREAGRPLVFACTHIDTAEDAWLPSARRVHAELDAVADNEAIVLAGDFNCAAGCNAHRYLLDAAGFRDTWYACGQADDGVMTYNGFTPLTTLPTVEVELQRFLEATSPADGEFAHYQNHVRRYGNYRIDWILVRGPLAVTAAWIDRGDNWRAASDHYPAIASLLWQ